MGNSLRWIELGRKDYFETWQIQQEIFRKVKAGTEPDTIILVEHPHTITFGKTSQKTHLLLNAQELQNRGISVYDIDRGGDVTYHGPGQLVSYPILNLQHYKKDIHWYLRCLETVVIETLKFFSIQAGRLNMADSQKNYTGVWVGQEKICAIGVKVSHWVTMHGLALNINTNLSFFDFIVPCGISDKKVTSMKNLCGHELAINDVIYEFKKNFENYFNSVPLQTKSIS